MKAVIDWIWLGPWWAPLIGAIYFSVLIGIALAPILGIWKSGCRK
jgi:hypothetical protein